MAPSEGAKERSGCNEFEWRLSNHLMSASRLTVDRRGCERHKRHYNHLDHGDPTRFPKEPSSF